MTATPEPFTPMLPLGFDTGGASPVDVEARPTGAEPPRRVGSASDAGRPEVLGSPVDPEPSEPLGPPEVEVRTSTRRRKTATAFWQGGRIVVVVPAHVRGPARHEMVEWLVGRVRAKRPGSGSSDRELALRAVHLADRYLEGVRPASIRWVANQSKRWGSCSAGSGDIRLSHRLRDVPGWVLDAVVVHELAHLLEPNHSARFHLLADRYPRQREASLFLEGFQLGMESGR